MALQSSLQLVPIDVRINLIKRKVSLSFWGQDIPRFDAGSHKSYINSCTFSGAYIIRLSQPLTTKVEIDDGRREMDLVIDFHFQNIVRLVFYGDFYADDVISRMLCDITALLCLPHTHNVMWLFMQNTLHVG